MNSAHVSRTRAERRSDRQLPSPAGPSASLLLSLQSTAGNQSVAELVAGLDRRSASPHETPSVQRAVYLGADTTTPLDWDKLGDDREHELEAAGKLPAALLRNAWFNTGYHRFPDWNAFIARVKTPLPEAPPKDSKIPGAFAGKDKAYGLEKPREKYAGEKLIAAKYYTVDKLNNRIGISNATPAALHLITDAEAQDYAEWLYFHQRYGPAAASQARLRGDAPQGLDAEMIKKSCKDAISYTTRTQHNVIHFELSGIDLGAVVGKRNAGGWGITAAELRYIYRQMVRGEAEVDLKQVQFYLRGERVAAPWETEPELWARYAPKRTPSSIGARVSLPSKDDYKAMKQAATLRGKHGMLSSKNYGTGVEQFKRYATVSNWDSARVVVDKLHKRLNEMETTEKKYWRSAELKAQYFDPIYKQVESLRALA
ncbi:MAG: hypothetical protein ACRDV9_00135 [Acidimicrobiia bacterium]